MKGSPKPTSLPALALTRVSLPNRRGEGAATPRAYLCAHAPVRIQLIIDSESFRELTGTTNYSRAIKKNLTKSPRTIYAQAFPAILRSLKQSIHCAHIESGRLSNPQECASVNANPKK